jgi:hypothetical protein
MGSASCWLEKALDVGKKKFKTYPICYIHVDIAEVRIEETMPCLFIAIDRSSKIAYEELLETADRNITTAFLNNLITAVRCKIHIILTEHGGLFCYPHPV